MGMDLWKAGSFVWQQYKSDARERKMQGQLAEVS